jgi:hypothetical protein
MFEQNPEARGRNWDRERRIRIMETLAKNVRPSCLKDKEKCSHKSSTCEAVKKCMPVLYHFYLKEWMK